MSASLSMDITQSSGGFGARLVGRIKSVSQSLQKLATTEVNAENTALGIQKLGEATQDVARFLRKKSIDTINAVRNSTTEDKAWFLANMGMGFGAKALILSGVATGGTSLLVAAAGGVITGTTRTIIDRARAHRDGDTAKLSQSFSRQLLMNTVSGGVISTATFGLLGGLNSLTGINLGETFARAVGKGLDGTKHAFMAMIPASEAATVPKIDRPLGLLNPKFNPPAVPASETLLTHKSAPAIPAAAFAQELQARQAKIDSLTLEHLRGLIEKTTGVKPAAELTAFELAKQFHPNHPQALLSTIQKNIQIPVTESRGIAAVIQSQPTKTIAEAVIPQPAAVQSIPNPSTTEVKLPDGTVRAVQMPPRPDIKAEWKLAFAKVQGIEFERLAREDYLAQFGTEAPDDISAQDIAKRINPENSGQYIEEIARKAELIAKDSLPADKIRGACLTNLPASEESHQARGRILPNTCSVDSDAPVQEGEYITMRDVGEPISKPEKRGLWNGIRAIFAGAQTPATEFMSEAIGKAEINQMAADKLAMNLR